MRWRRAAAVMAGAVAVGAAVLAHAHRTAIADPVIRSVELAVLPAATPIEVRIALLTDIHVAGPDMPPERLSRIVGQVNALHPDAVLIAGDLVSDKRLATRRYPIDRAIAPLAGLRSRLGSFAVLGNHDHWRDAASARRALRDAGVTVLVNGAARAGPLAIGGLDDAFTGHDDLPRRYARWPRPAACRSCSATAPILFRTCRRRSR